MWYFWKFGLYTVIASLTRTIKFAMWFGSLYSFPIGVSRFFRVTYLFCPSRSSLFPSPRFSSVRSMQYSVVAPFPFRSYVAVVPRLSRSVMSRICVLVVRILRLRPGHAAVQQDIRCRATAIPYQLSLTAPRLSPPPPKHHRRILQSGRYSLVLHALHSHLLWQFGMISVSN